MGDIDALNYPYIHIRSVGWLKRTLLLFPHVVRIVPGGFSAFDTDEIEKFTRLEGRRGPLLRRARIYDDAVVEAQHRLLRTLKTDLANHRTEFLAKFGRHAAGQARPLTEKSYQIHSDKFLGELGRFLVAEGLAWVPRISERDGEGYLEFHPKVGAVIMSTLAIACAANEGLEVVTEFPKIHDLPTPNLGASVYEYLIGSGDDDATRPPISGDEVFRFIVYRRCNPRLLTPSRLQALNNEWEAASALRDFLQEAARKKNDREIRNVDRREQYLNDIANDAMKKWSAERANMSNIAGDVFGKGSVSKPLELLQKLTEKAFSPIASGGAAGAAAGQTLVGNLTTGALVGVSAGFAIGLVSFVAEVAKDVRARQRNSPLRYLTMMEKNGVAFTVDE